MSLKCYYHPEREAQSKCEKCVLVICVECKMVYHKIVHRGTGDNRYAYFERYEYCPICYYDTEIKKYKSYSIGCIFVAVFMVIGLIMMIFPMSGFYNPMMFVVIMLLSSGILISVVVFFYLRFVYSPKKTAEFNAKKEEFLQRIKTPTSTKKAEITTNFCPECGTRVEPDASVCSYCGFIIKE